MRKKAEAILLELLVAILETPEVYSLSKAKILQRLINELTKEQ